MPSIVNPKLLRPHPKNREYFADLPAEKYAEIKRSIEANGIRDPLKVLPNYTVVAGNQRLAIALELGLEGVPVEIRDWTPEEAEYLLIADNEERRGVDEDPIRKARRAKFLAEYWGVRKGGDRRSNRQNGQLKSAKDIAATVGVEASHLSRVLKLNDLIPELQSLVSSGKLGPTAAEQLAYLSVETQRELHRAVGEAIGDLTVKETKNLRVRAEDAERLQQELAGTNTRAAEVEDALREAQGELAALKETLDGAVNAGKKEATEIEKDRVVELENRINGLNEKINGLEQARKDDAAQVEDLQNQLTEARKKVSEAAKEADRGLQRKLAHAEAEIERLKASRAAGDICTREELVELAKQKAYIESQIINRKNGLVVVNQIRDAVKIVVAVEPFLQKMDATVKDFLNPEEIEYQEAVFERIAGLLRAMSAAPLKEGKVIDIDSYVVYDS